MVAIAKRSREIPPRRPKALADQDYRVGLRWSLIAHVLVFAAIILKGLVFPGTPSLYVPTLRVDVVGLPDILKKDLKNTPSSKEISDALKKAEEEAKQIKPVIKPKAPAEKPPEEVAKKDEMVLKPKIVHPESEAAREKKLKAALDRMKALARITSETTTKKAGAPLIKGNAISKGSSLSGDARESAQANYYDDIRSRLQDNWALPVWIARQKLSAQVQIYIDAHGRLANFRIAKSSGNSQFDEAVKKTIADSAPFPAPPAELASDVLIHGILVGFPL